VNEREMIHKLARAAADHAPPPLDVTAAVMRAVRGPDHARSGAPQWLWELFAGASAAAALAVFLAALGAWSAWHDPLRLWLVPMEMVMQ